MRTENELSAVGIEKVQIYNHSTNSYDGVDIGIYTYAVGSAYFVQAPTASTVVEYTHSATNPLRAPSRERGVSEFQLTLTREGDSNFADRLYVGADEEALNEYEIGRDLTKFGTPTDAKVAQIWASAYGMQLCDIDMPLTNDAASCELGMFAPKAGAYTLAIKAAPSDATLYLTYEGNIIWDLTMSAYEFDLSKGTTEGYGLLLEAKKAPKVATGVEDVQQSDLNVQKIIRNGHVYILRDGQMYDVTGRNVR